jgi:hypothetical protein
MDSVKGTPHGETFSSQYAAWLLQIVTEPGTQVE